MLEISFSHLAQVKMILTLTLIRLYISPFDLGVLNQDYNLYLPSISRGKRRYIVTFNYFCVTSIHSFKLQMKKKIFFGLAFFFFLIYFLERKGIRIEIDVGELDNVGLVIISTCNAGDPSLIPGQILWRREQLPAPVFLPREFKGQRSLTGYSSWGCKGSNTTE